MKKFCLVVAAVVCGAFVLVAAAFAIYRPRHTSDSRIPTQSITLETQLSSSLPEPTTLPETAPQTEPDSTEPDSTEPEVEMPLIVIDPGHQLHGDSGLEPLGPGSQQLKARVSDGTQGVVTYLPEHELNLAVSLLLKQMLLERGYDVVLTREVAEVSLSNAERAQIANDLGADAFLRIHANGDSDSSVDGAMTLCMTPSNPYNADVYEESRLLSDLILQELCKASGARKRSVWETDTMTGINWSQVPVTIVEMGFMSNPEEDRLLSDPAYQSKIAEGIVNGIECYFSALNE